MMFPDHKVVPWPQKWATLTKKRQISPKNSTVRSDGGSGSCYIGDQQFDFHQMVLSQEFRAQEEVFRQQSGSLSTKMAWIG